MFSQVSALEAAAILLAKGKPGAISLPDDALILALVEAFHATGRRAAQIPLDLPAIRAAATTEWVRLKAA